MAKIRSFNGITPQLEARVYIDDSACVIGDVHLGEDCSVWPMAVIRGDMHRIRIGRRTSIQDNSVLHITHDGSYDPGGHPLLVGDDVIVGHRVVLHGCTVGDRVLIGMGSIIMDGASIADEVVIGANSLVPPGRRLEGGWLYKGSPARPARRLTEAEQQYFRYSAANYVKLKNQYLAQARGATPR